MALSISDIIALYRAAGAARYGMESINQEQHALQCAHLAEQAGSTLELVAAALLHDLGRLVSVEHAPGANKNDLHEFLAIPFLRGVFPDAVIEPIRLHVDAKRYLCGTEPAYRNTLSDASRRSLEVQGGRFGVRQSLKFIVQPFAEDAVQLRRWDDCAKSPLVTTPGWEHYGLVLERARTVPASSRELAAT